MESYSVTVGNILLQYITVTSLFSTNADVMSLYGLTTFLLWV